MGKLFDWVMDFLYSLASIVIGWLPDSPFQNADFTKGLEPFGNIMGHINYFVPIGTIVLITAAYVAAVAIWYAARWLLRFVQYID